MSDDSPDRPEYVIVPGSRVQIEITPEQVNEFYALIGKCTTQWARIERLLFEVCVWALGVDEARTAAIFYAWPTLGGRRNVTNELVRLAAPNDDEWKGITDAIDEHQPFRNMLAHEPVRQQFEIIWDMFAEGGPKPIRSDGRLEVHTEPKKLLRGKGKVEQTISIPELEAHLEATKRLHADLALFLKARQEAVLSKSAAPDSPSSPAPSNQISPADPERG